MSSRRVRDEMFGRNMRGLLREIRNTLRGGLQIRGQHVTIGAQRIRPLSERRRLRRGPRRRIGKDHGAIQRDNIGGAIHMSAVSLPRALPIAEMDAPSLVDRCPLARAVKFRREVARRRNLVGRVAEFARHFHAARAHQLLQLVLRIEFQIHLLARHPRRLRNGLAVHQCHVLPIDARRSERVHAFHKGLPRAGIA